MDTWDTVHAGDVVLGHDQLEYGVVGIDPSPFGPVVTLTRYGQQQTAQPPPGTPITVISRADVTAEARAFAILAGASLNPQVIRETYQP